ncbi:ScbA/BarX family gamma-butyrolactone biosynthesis protein [Streptomyces sp. NPDC058308]|uniref:ScbA/BarX family gamma-butyrolactone biosynthesis protein n=1 Tax=Streptomyces sp. NPDC058308 TaxID=3346440 RepID=UPI0036E9506A
MSRQNGSATRHERATQHGQAPQATIATRIPQEPLAVQHGWDALIPPAPQGILRAGRQPVPLRRLTTTVHREYVHRTAQAEVFLTGHEKTGRNTYALTGQWPRAHTYFTTADGLGHDHLQVCETFRQIGIYLAHTEHDVPLSHHFVMQDMTVVTHPEHLGIQDTPTNLIINVTFIRASRGSHFSADFAIVSNDRVIATGRGRFTCISPAAYRRIRTSSHPTTPTLSDLRYSPTHQDPTAFGRTHSRDLVLAPTRQPHTWRLNADPRHPVLFDHDGDHIPGMVLIEAARQSAHPQLPRNTLLTHSHTEWHRYVELAVPCYITATPRPTTRPDTHTVHVTGHQNNEVTFTARLTATARNERQAPAAGVPGWRRTVA